MLLLPKNTSVSDELSFHTAVAAGLHETFGLKTGSDHLETKGPWPEFRCVRLDLTGACIFLDRVPPAPTAPSKLLTSFQCGELDLIAKPMNVGGKAQLHIELHAEGARMAIAEDTHDRNWLTLKQAVNGRARLNLAARDLEELFLSSARKAAEQHGVVIEEGSIDLQPAEANALKLAASIQAKKMFFKSQFHLEGKIRLDDSLNAHFSELSCRGEGAMGTMAAGFLRPHLDAWNGRTLPLMGLVFSDLDLRDVKVTVSGAKELVAEAAFGSE